MPRFSEGEWVLFEHGVVQIKRTEAGRVKSVSTGSFETSSYDLSDRIFPLTLAGKSCADWFDYYYHDLHREEGGGKLNWPDLSRRITDLWADTMLVLDDEVKRGEAYDKAQSFFLEVKDKLRNLRRTETTDGLKLFK